MSEHCPVCGCKVEIIGHTTNSYKPIDKSEKLAEALKLILSTGINTGTRLFAKQALEEYRKEKK